MKLNQGVEVVLSETTVRPSGSLLNSESALLCEASFSPPQPVVLQIGTRRLATETTDPQSQVTPWLTPGLRNWTTLEEDYAGVRVVYGMQGVMRRFVMDARAGSFQLPPCDNVKASLVFFTTGLLWSGSEVAIKGTLHEGVGSETLWPTMSFSGSIAAAATNSAEYPPQARLFDFWGGKSTTNFVVNDTPENRHYWQRSNVTGIFLPPWGPFDIPANSNGFTVTNNGAAVDVFTGRFYLEP